MKPLQKGMLCLLFLLLAGEPSYATHPRPASRKRTLRRALVIAAASIAVLAAAGAVISESLD